MTAANLITAILTGSTCGDGCWHAREEICRCSCGGVNHGILNHGGSRPQRTAKHGGELYELAAVIPGTQPGECGIDAIRRASAEVSRVMAERFPGIDAYGYGEYRMGNLLPVLDRKVGASQAKWPEVQAVPNAYRLVWARPAGARYVMRGPEYTSYWSDAR